jgi:uncharacterized protein
MPIFSARRDLREPLGFTLRRTAGKLPPKPSRGSGHMAHYFEIKTNKAGEFVAYFKYNSEAIFWTEGYKSKASAKNAIESILKNGPGAEVREAE